MSVVFFPPCMPWLPMYVHIYRWHSTAPPTGPSTEPQSQVRVGLRTPCPIHFGPLHPTMIPQHLSKPYTVAACLSALSHCVLQSGLITEIISFSLLVNQSLFIYFIFSFHSGLILKHRSAFFMRHLHFPLPKIGSNLLHQHTSGFDSSCSTGKSHYTKRF